MASKICKNYNMHFVICLLYHLTKVTDDMAYRRQKGAPATNTRQSGSQGYVTYTTTSLTLATSQDR